ncbi:MAG: COP23 domain-containing protein [Crocosphaera sp.]|nr:COP23 domain-containing protein [Crocosphaera sp.]
MLIRQKIFALGTTVSLAGNMAMGLQPVTANTTSSTSAITFNCEVIQGTPTITATSSQWNNETRQFIRWTSDVGKNSGYTPLTRCKEITPRLQASFADGNPYITHGYKNNNPIICTTDKSGKGCQTLLFTLDWRDFGTETIKGKLDPRMVLEDIFALNERKFSGRALRQGSCRTYIDMNAILEGETKIAEEVCHTVN